MLTRLAALLAPQGLGERVGTARLPGLLAAMQTLRQSLAGLPPVARWEDEAAAAIMSTLDATLSGLTGALTEARKASENIPKLVRAMTSDPATAGRLGRAEWLSDGWPWLCALWSVAPDPAARLGLLNETLLALPVLPAEIANWPGFDRSLALPAAPRARMTDDPTAVKHLDEVTRNEGVMARAA